MIIDQDLNQKITKVWHYSEDSISKNVYNPSAEARDVAVAQADGSIYVTGFLEGYTHSENRNDVRQCFILQLDGKLNKINARSFGLTPTTYTDPA